MGFNHRRKAVAAALSALLLQACAGNPRVEAEAEPVDTTPAEVTRPWSVQRDPAMADQTAESVVDEGVVLREATTPISQRGSLPRLPTVRETPPSIEVPPDQDVVQLDYEQVDLRQVLEEVADAIGISLVMMALSRNIAINSVYLSESVTPFSLGFSLHQIPDALMQQGAAAIGMLNMEVARQASTIAYVNDFKLMMWIVLASAPLVLLLKKPPPLSAQLAG